MSLNLIKNWTRSKVTSPLQVDSPKQMLSYFKGFCEQMLFLNLFIFLFFWGRWFWVQACSNTWTQWGRWFSEHTRMSYFKGCFLCCFWAGVCTYQNRPRNTPTYMHILKQTEHYGKHVTSFSDGGMKQWVLVSKTSSEWEHPFHNIRCPYWLAEHSKLSFYFRLII